MSTETSHALLEVDLGAVVENWRDLCGWHSSGVVAGVIKADAYGLGAKQIAEALYAAGCRHFFVAYLDEALAVRDLVPEAMVAVLSGPVPGSEEAYFASDLTPVLGSREDIERWINAGRQQGCMTGRGGGNGAGAILHVDTGMCRLGLDASDMASIAADRGQLDPLNLRYVMTHLVSSEIADDPINLIQLERFKTARSMLPDVPSSLSNSSGIFLGPSFGSNLARPGAALYGINPTPGRPNPMRQAVRLMVRVLAVHDIAAGTSVGYNATWTAARPSRIATAAVGYADGYHRSLAGRASACFDGAPVPLVGRVSMDLTTFDVTDHPQIRPGSWLEAIGPNLPPDAVAEMAGTNGYEVLTSLGRRFHRVYRPA